MTLDLSPWTFFLVFGRTSALVSFFPMFQDSQLPRSARVAIALWLSLAIFPIVPATAFQPTTIPDLAMALGFEVIVGSLFAFVIRMVFATILLGTQWIDSEIGFQVAQQINPISGVPNSPFGTMAFIVSILIFWVTGCFEQIILLWARIFQLLPPPVLAIPLRTGETLVQISSQIFLGGLQIATPVIVIMFLVSFTLGLMARALQGVNIFVESFTLKILVGMGSLILLIPLFMILFQKQIGKIPDLWAALARALR